MRKAIKKTGTVIYAYQLGDHSSMEIKLMEEGKIRMKEDGGYELFSQEAINGRGESAKAGDYFKVDSKGCPYPNSRKFFEEHNRKIEENQYIQIPFSVNVWTREEPEDEIIRYLLDNRFITVNPNDRERYFNACLWGTQLSAAMDAVIIIYDVVRDMDGELKSVDFNFVAKEEFDKTYVCTAAPLKS